MKRQMILAVAVIFMLALFAPAVSYSAQVNNTVVTVDSKEKKEVSKTETTTEKKTEATATETKACCNKATAGETKACCNKEQKSGCCKSSGTESKAQAGEKKACCESKK